MIDWSKVQQGTPTRPSSGGVVDWGAIRSGQPPRRRPAPSRGTYLSGGAISDAFDVLRTGEYAVGGVLSGKGVRRGIRERTESAPEFERIFGEAGMGPGFARKAAGFVASVVVDPINLIGPLGIGRAAATGIAKVGRGAIRVAAPALERRIVGRELLEPILEKGAIAEGKGIEETFDVGRRLRRDAISVARTKRDARRLDQAIGGYFDAGADTMLHQLSRGVPVAQARQAGQVAQQAFLQSLSPDVQAFVTRWVPELAADDARLAQNLVRVGMMRPDTAVKWEGMHLRRIYQKFEDPSEFVEFLQRADPLEAARLSGKLERGIPIGRVGQPIPGAVKQRKTLTAVQQAGLGVIEQASSRYVAGRVLAERAIARGEAFAEVAQQFSRDENFLRQLGTGAKDWMQMPETVGWGALAGRWLPNEIAKPLLTLRRTSQGVEKFLERTTGWFKMAKVVLNPATHFRNMRTNLSLAHNAVGLGALNPITWARAIQEVATNGQAFKEAKAVSSAFIDTFTNTEIRNFVGDGTERGVIAGLRRIGAAAGRLYQAEEQVGKMAAYLSSRGRGLSPQASAEIAEWALFNYRKVPAEIDRLRRIGIFPFITFPYKVATQTIPAVIRNPGRMAAQAKAIGQISEPLTEEEQRSLPAYMRSGGYIKLPFRVNGKPVLYDLTYEIAFGDIAEAGTPIGNVLAAFRGELPRESLIALLPPVAQIAAEIALNRSAFTGREIVPEGETPTESRKLFARHAARFASPAIIGKALPGGELRRSLEAARPGGASGISPSGQPAAPISQALASALAGLRTVQLDVGHEKRMRSVELQGAMADIEKRMRSVAFRTGIGNLTQEQGQQRLRELQEEARRVIERFQATGAIAR